MASIIVLIFMAFYVGHCIEEARVLVKEKIDDNPVLSVISKITKKMPNPVKKAIEKRQKKNQNLPDGKMSSAEVKRVKKFRTDIHIDAGVYTNLAPFKKKYVMPKPTVGVSVFSYGPSRNENSWRFVRVGVGGWPDSGLDVTVAPVMYNIGSKLPVITNTYIHAHFGYNVTNNRFVGGVGASLSF